MGSDCGNEFERRILVSLDAQPAHPLKGEGLKDVLGRESFQVLRFRKNRD
jgi:hypothetical protein